jgi:hypothetical protein
VLGIGQVDQGISGDISLNRRTVIIGRRRVRTG